MENKWVVAIPKIVLSLILLACLLKAPYGYYQFVRVVAFVVFAYLALTAYSNKQIALVVVYTISSLLFNPIFKIVLGRQIWQIVDVALAVVLLLTTAIDLIHSKKVSAN